MDGESVEVDMEDIPPGYILIRKEDGLFAFLKMEPEDEDQRAVEVIEDEVEEVQIEEVDDNEYEREEIHVIEDDSQIVMDHLTPVTIEQTVTDDQVEYLDDSLIVVPGGRHALRQERKPRSSNSIQMWKGIPLPSELNEEQLKRFKTNHLLQRLSDRVKRNRQKVSIYGNKNENLRKLISNQRVHMVKMGFHVKDISRFHAFCTRQRDKVRSSSPEIDKRFLTDLEQMEYEKRQLEKEYSSLRKKLKSLLSSHRRYKKVFVENHEKILKGPKKRATNDALLKNESYLMQLASESDSSDDNGGSRYKKDKVFKCYHCNYSAASKEDLVPHIEGHLLQKKFECPECPFFTSKITPFLEHMKSHPGAKAFSCKTCDFKSAYPSAMRNHESTHLVVKPFLCPTCGFRTSRSDHLRNHLRKHANDRPYKCTICSFTSKYASGLSKHKKTVHEGDPSKKKRKYKRHKLVKQEPESDDAAGETTEIELDEEGKTVRIRNIKRVIKEERSNHEEKRMSLRTHVKKKVLKDFVDGDEIEEDEEFVKEVFKAEDRDEDYVMEQDDSNERYQRDDDEEVVRNDYQRIIQDNDDNIDDNPGIDEMDDEDANFSEEGKQPTALKDLLSSYVIYQCVFCDYSCEMKSSLLQHLRTHMENWMFSCRACDFVAANPHDLQAHTEEHKNVGENGCSYCDQIFDTRDKLKKHIVKRHPQGKPLSCVFCDFISSNRLSMKTHMLGHKSKKVWQCLICNYKASFRSGLKRHLRIHTGERPYHCPHCEFNAAQCSHLSRHLRRFHADESQYVESRPNSPYMM